MVPSVIHVFMYICYVSLLQNAATEEEALMDLMLPDSLVDFNMLVKKDKESKVFGDFIQIKVDGAAVGEACDMALYTTYLQPLYNATSRSEFTDKMQVFLEHLKTDLTLEKKSCFTRIPPDKSSNQAGKLQFLKCDSGTSTCICNDEEPYKSTLVPNTKECRIDESTLGSKCKRSRTDLLNQKFYNGFRRGISVATTQGDVAVTWNQFVKAAKKYLQEDSLESDRRHACINVNLTGAVKTFNTENLECSPAGECQCVDDGQRFGYVAVAVGNTNSSRCLAKKGAISVFKVLDQETKNTIRVCSTECADAKLVSKPINIGTPESIKITTCNVKGDNGTTALGSATIQLYLFTIFISLNIGFPEKAI